MRTFFPEKYARALPLILAFFSLQGIGSCSRDVARLCTQELPRLQAEVSANLVTLSTQSIGEKEAGRKIASETRLSESERARLKNWSREKLKQAQLYMDALDFDPKFSAARGEVSHLADDLVAFHGYVTTGKRERMVSKLAEIDEHMKKARRISCDSAAAN